MIKEMIGKLLFHIDTVDTDSLFSELATDIEMKNLLEHLQI